MKLRLCFAPFLLLAFACSKEKSPESPPEVSVDCTDPLDDDDVTLDSDEIYSVVEANYRELRHCYQQALEKNPSLSGRIDVNLIIEADGHTSQVCSGGSTLPSSSVVVCVIRTFAGFQFSAREEQAAGIYPITFSPN